MYKQEAEEISGFKDMRSRFILLVERNFTSISRLICFDQHPCAGNSSSIYESPFCHRGGQAHGKLQVSLETDSLYQSDLHLCSLIK